MSVAKNSGQLLPPDYLAHDAEYRRRRGLGREGWDEPGSFQQTLGNMRGFLDGVVLSPRPSLIELGCGAGDISLDFAGRGFRVTGIDVAPFAVDWAREKAAARSLAATFFVADLTRPLEFSPEPADVVIDGHCLHCIIGADRAIFLENARRCLKPGGIFHINTMCNEPHPPHDQKFDMATRCFVVKGVPQRYFGLPGSIVEEIEGAGFEVLRQEVILAQYEGDEDCLLVNATHCRGS